jgi:xanthine/uracil permease
VPSGAGLVMFGMVAATGARLLTGVNFKSTPNLFTFAVSVGFGMIRLVVPAFFDNLPHELQPPLESGILLSAVVSVVLDLFFNGSVASRLRVVTLLPLPRRRARPAINLKEHQE